MTEDEKIGFDHGCIVMLQMFECGGCLMRYSGYSNTERGYESLMKELNCQQYAEEEEKK